MKIRRFVAKDMRTALEQIKHELGVDAVIMSNKKIPEGVELMAAVDYSQQTPAPTSEKANNQESTSAQASMESRDVENDVVSLSSSKNLKQPMPNEQNSAGGVDSLSALLQRKVQREQASQQAKTQSNLAQQDIEQQLKSFTDRLEQGSLYTSNNSEKQTTSEPVNNQHNFSQNEHQANEPLENHQASGISPASKNNRVDIGASEEVEKMRKEMASIRELLEHQVSGLMWQDMAKKDPCKALMVNRLLNIGINDQVADQISSAIPVHNNEEQAWETAKELLAQQLNTTNNDIIHRGGVVSLVGPTGVGKTTTIAKLAARFAQIHGADKVAMISTDSYRIAGFEQLSTYGRIIGCQVKLAKDAKALDTLLEQYADKKLVLIDTAGMGQRDMRLSEHLTALMANSRVRIRNYLVLAANTQQRVMQENVERFKKVPLAGAIYTKLDESLSIGEIIATSIQNGLAIGYLTDGQRVPEDIKVANAEKLVTLADRLATKVNCQNSWRPMPTSHAVSM
ncbi:flagellar biosynthesis protein FlhF [Thalassotalea castellviae]|uniref:Flagellar biosynthesis protein FlhF n=1 Tax=Thalassotalea castellviae TaxID=3075612 RepID=A0ABU3A129_9GAMM|nr:flagellar biosynthesis protein FlhF [Thalassotalea sp. W431]MDT0602833.1 flagellar biosynthesis protein FlhF [Thalassotalea sp. W431]